LNTKRLRQMSMGIQTRHEYVAGLTRIMGIYLGLNNNQSTISGFKIGHNLDYYKKSL
jgi:hypothetical protein